MKKQAPLITIYTIDIHRVNSLPVNSNFWCFTELEVTQGFENFLAWAFPDSIGDEALGTKYKQFIQETYPTLYKLEEHNLDYPYSIQGLQYYKKAGKEKLIGQVLYDDACNVLATSSGDDSYFDYDPGYAYMVMTLLEQLPGCKKHIKSLQKILDARED